MISTDCSFPQQSSIFFYPLPPSHLPPSPPSLPFLKQALQSPRLSRNSLQAQADLELARILLPQQPECWDSRGKPPQLASAISQLRSVRSTEMNACVRKNNKYAIWEMRAGSLWLPWLSLYNNTAPASDEINTLQ